MGRAGRAWRWGLLAAACASLPAAIASGPSGGALSPSQAPAPFLRPVVIDPGHGGDDLGGVALGRREKEIALAVALKLQARLQEAGVPVRLTRAGDEALRLDRRVQKSIDWGGALFLSLHTDLVRDPRPQGITVYSFGRGRRERRWRPRHPGLPPLSAPSREQARASAFFADALARSLRSAGLPAGPRERAGYYVLKNPRLPSALVELGYLSNPGEAARLESPEYQDLLARALARGLTTYLASLPANRTGASLASR